jgi:hypothetical protein
MCKKNRELVDHLLLYREIASALWNTIFANVGLGWLGVYLGGWQISLLAGERPG